MATETKLTDRVSRLNQSDQRQAIEYQTHALSRVSRTFALTIPQLPPEVRFVIGNAYLLCRLADTIEDTPALDVPSKRRFLSRFSDVVQDKESAETFSNDLVPSLTDGANDSDLDLVSNTNLVVDFHRQMPEGQRDAVEKCVKKMCSGMSEFVDTGSDGLADQAQVDRYCYFVAGVVGEMITEVFSGYSGDIAARRDELYCLSSQFGSGLQLINIMKDHREDLDRGVCWLPRRILDGHALPGSASLRDLSAVPRILHLMGVARKRLEKSLRYIRLIPIHETGIRRFLAWTLSFACLTFCRIHANPGFRSGKEVKISRRQVYGSIAAVNLAIRSNRALNWLFNVSMPRLASFETRVHKSRR